MAVNTDKSMVLVSAVVLFDRQSRVLLCRRPRGKPLAGYWELPGGKIEENESAEAALVRELAEELGLKVDEANLIPLTFASHEYKTFYLLMPVFACTVWQGEPTPNEGQMVNWVPVDAIDQFKLPPADLPILPAIRDFVRKRLIPDASSPLR